MTLTPSLETIIGSGVVAALSYAVLYVIAARFARRRAADATYLDSGWVAVPIVVGMLSFIGGALLFFLFLGDRAAAWTVGDGSPWRPVFIIVGAGLTLAVARVALDRIQRFYGEARVAEPQVESAARDVPRDRAWAVQVLVRGLILAPAVSVLIGAVTGLLLGVVSDLLNPVVLGMVIIGGIGVVTTLQYWRTYVAAVRVLVRL